MKRSSGFYRVRIRGTETWVIGEWDAHMCLWFIVGHDRCYVSRLLEVDPVEVVTQEQ